MSVLDQSVTACRYVYLMVTASGMRKLELSPYHWTCLSTAAQHWSLAGWSKWGRTYRVRETSFAQQPHGGVLSFCLSSIFLLSVLKVLSPITRLIHGRFNHTHLGVLLTLGLSRNTNLTNLYSDKERRKTWKPQVGEGGTICNTHGLKTQLKPKVE
jgi:hypothetical protein